MKKNTPQKAKIFITLLVPLTSCALLFLIFGGKLRGLTAAEMIRYMPQNQIWGMMALVGLYALKSVSVVFPLTVLFLAAGIMFELPIALCITVIGLFVCVTIPYLLGWWFGNSLEEVMIHRFPKLQKIEDYRCRNQVLFSYLLRVIGILPGDIVSWYFGSTKTNFILYTIGSLIGLFPAALIQVLIGDKLASGFSWQLVLFALLLVAISFVSSWIYNRASVNKKTR